MNFCCGTPQRFNGIAGRDVDAYRVERTVRCAHARRTTYPTRLRRQGYLGRVANSREGFDSGDDPMTLPRPSSRLLNSFIQQMRGIDTAKRAAPIDNFMAISGRRCAEGLDAIPFNEGLLVFSVTQHLVQAFGCCRNM